MNGFKYFGYPQGGPEDRAVTAIITIMGFATFIFVVVCGLVYLTLPTLCFLVTSGTVVCLYLLFLKHYKHDKDSLK